MTGIRHVRVPERTPCHRRPRRVDRDHRGGVSRPHGWRRRPGHGAALRGRGLDSPNADEAGGWPDSTTTRSSPGSSAAEPRSVTVTGPTPRRTAISRSPPTVGSSPSDRISAAAPGASRSTSPWSAWPPFRARAAIGSWPPMAASSPMATPSSTARRALSTSTRRSWGWRRPLTARAIGSSRPTGASSPTATPSSTARLRPRPTRTSSAWRRRPTARGTGR